MIVAVPETSQSGPTRDESIGRYNDDQLSGRSGSEGPR